MLHQVGPTIRQKSSSTSSSSFNPFKRKAVNDKTTQPDPDASSTSMDGVTNEKMEKEQPKEKKISWMTLPAFDENDRYGDKARKDGKFDHWLNKFTPLRMLRDSVSREKEKLRYDIRNTPTREYRLLAAADFKLFTASEKMMPAGNAISFPSSYKLLTTVQSFGALAREGSRTRSYVDVRAEIKRRRATLVFVSFVADAGRQSEAWLTPFEEKFADNKNVTFFDLGITEGLAYKSLRSVLDKNLIKQTPPERYDNMLIWYASNEETYTFKRHLGIENSKTCYAYLCDSKGRVRWTATGQPHGGEMATLIKLTNELLATN